MCQNLEICYVFRILKRSEILSYHVQCFIVQCTSILQGRSRSRAPGVAYHRTHDPLAISGFLVLLISIRHRLRSPKSSQGARPPTSRSWIGLWVVRDDGRTPDNVCLQSGAGKYDKRLSTPLSNRRLQGGTHYISSADDISLRKLRASQQSLR